MTIARRIFKGLAWLATLGVLGIVTLLGSLWLERRTNVTLPGPTGPFPVGRVTLAWTDEAHPDSLAPAPGTKRQLLVWVWYPSAPGQSLATMEDYLTAPIAASIAPTQQTPLIGKLLRGVMTLLSHDPSKIHWHSLRGTELSPREPSFPLVIMRAGATAEVTNYSTLAEDLTSHGYVVVGVDAAYRTGRVVFPDGRVVERTPANNPELYSGDEFLRVGQNLLAAWTADIGFVLDQLERLNASDSTGRFAGRFDLTRVGVFGHSFGGAQAAQFCSQDARCAAGIDVDGAPLGTVIETGMSKPFMFLLSDHGGESDSVSRRIGAEIQSIYDRLPTDQRLRIAIRGAHHLTFSDDGAVLKSRIVRGALRLFGKLDIDGRRQLAVTSYCLHQFFDQFLKGETVSPSWVSSPLYPEIQVLE